MYYRLFLILFAFQLQHIAFGQNNTPIFYEVIKGDSIMMFFNDLGYVTEKKCRQFMRFTRIDTNGDFMGFYQDIRLDNAVLGKGYYSNGQKNGYFEFYHSNGKIESKGRYLNNIKIGEWEYFYNNGIPERTLKITESDTLMIKFVDEAGNLKVSNGNGIFSGFIEDNSVKATGKIENGKPNGKWTSTFQGKTYAVEEFNQGKLIKGSFPNAKASGRKEYKNKTFLNILIPSNYLNSVEKLRFEKCKDEVVNNTQKRNFDIAKLRSDLRSKIGRIVEYDLKNERTNDYVIGDNYMSIQFSTDEKGQAKDFLLLTSWGEQFFNPISSSIKSQVKFPPSIKILFFHLKLHFPGGYSYQSTFRFSDSRSFD
jgi:hypothetical protein